MKALEVGPVPFDEDASPEAYYYAPLDVYVGKGGQRLNDLSEEGLGTWLIAEPIARSDALLEHYRVWLRSGSRARADAWRESQSLVFSNYGQVKLGKPIDWAVGDDGRANLSWQLHSFFFLRDFAASHQSTGDEGYLESAQELILSWADEALTCRPTARFAWNDHSTAYRLHALTQYYAYLRSFGAFRLQWLACLYKLIVRHQAVLLSRGLYSKGTNHGLDQAFYLYVSAIVCPEHSETSKTRVVAKERLRYELLCSFADDGVHVENSPEYHDLVLASVTYMGHVFGEIERDDALLKGINDRLFEGVRFLAHIIRPDGLLPTIGDSTQIPPRSSHQRLSAAPAFEEFIHACSGDGVYPGSLSACAVFRSSGYVVFRTGATQPGLDGLHAVFKCGFLSAYHRHDDDNGIVLYADGEDWLVDGGLYKHEELDVHRIYLRSARAHNLMMPSGARTSRDFRKVKAGISVMQMSEERSVVSGTTRMFEGYLYGREVAFDTSRKSLDLTDLFTCERHPDSGVHRYELIFHVPSDKRIVTSDCDIRIESMRSSAVLRLSLDSRGMESVVLMKYANEDFLCRRSVAYGQLVDVQTVRVTYIGAPNLTVRTSLRFGYRDGDSEG